VETVLDCAGNAWRQLGRFSARVIGWAIAPWFASVAGCDYPAHMEAPQENHPRYRWPWLVLAAFLLGVALAIAWMSYAVHREKQQRDLNAPLPGAPARQ